MKDRAAAARQEYIYAELGVLGILSETRLDVLLVEELEYALWPELHEGRAATYGAILTRSSDFREYHDGIRMVSLGSVVANREAADGSSTFVWRSAMQGGTSQECQVACFGQSRFSDEIAIFALRDDALRTQDDEDPKSPAGVSDFFTVQRTDTMVRALCREGIIAIHNNLWTFRPYQYTFRLDDLAGTLWGEHLPQVAKVARSISRVAVHMLSPARIGTTIVWQMTPCALRYLDNSKAVQFPSCEGLSFRVRAHQWAIASIVRRRDGAILVDKNGLVTAANVFLNPEPLSHDRPSVGGARQRSAQEGSKHIDGIVITVSSDGPVRAYRQGELCMSTESGENVPSIATT